MFAYVATKNLDQTTGVKSTTSRRDHGRHRERSGTERL